MNVENPRLRLILGTQWQLLLVVLGVVALGAFAGAATTYQDQPVDTRTVDVNQQTVVTNTSHRATVVREGGLWPKGTVLEDKPVYIRNATPEVEMIATTQVSGADDARIRHVWLMTISVTSDGETFYEESQVLANGTHRGTNASTTATIDVTSVARRVANISEKASGAGTVSVTLTLRTSYRTNPDGEGYTGRKTYSAPIELRGTTYDVPDGLGDRTSHSSTRQQRIQQPRDWGSILSMSLVGLLALALAGAVVAVDPRAIDVEKARIDLHRTRYEEWISPGVIPMGISQQFVELETIEDVVDVAIDTNERVVYDRRRDLYAVISENLVYYFSTGGSWMESAFRPMHMGGEGGGGAGEDTPFRGTGPNGPPGPFDDFGFPEEGESPFSDGGGDQMPDGESPFDEPTGPPGGDPFDQVDGGDQFGAEEPFDGGGGERPFDGADDGGDGAGPFDGGDGGGEGPFDGGDGGGEGPFDGGDGGEGAGPFEGGDGSAGEDGPEGEESDDEGGADDEDEGGADGDDDAA